MSQKVIIKGGFDDSFVVGLIKHLIGDGFNVAVKHTPQEKSFDKWVISGIKRKDLEEIKDWKIYTQRNLDGSLTEIAKDGFIK